MVTAPHPRTSADLPTEMNALNSVIRRLEGELKRVVTVNDALKKDLEQERTRRLALERQAAELEERLRQTAQQMADRDNLLAEKNYLERERERLSKAVRDATERLRAAEHGGEKQASLAARLHAAHADAIDELQSVESQFERAMQVVAQAKAESTMAREERNALALRIKTTEAELRQVQHDRDELLSEVEQSRTALDEIRRSLVDACAGAPSGLNGFDESRAPPGSPEPYRRPGRSGS